MSGEQRPVDASVPQPQPSYDRKPPSPRKCPPWREPAQGLQQVGPAHTSAPVRATSVARLPMAPRGRDLEDELERAARGDREAVQQLLARHRDALRRMVAARLDRRVAA